MTELRVTIKNTSGDGGTFLTPVYLGFHDGSFDLFDLGQSASPGLESLAEDGSAALLASERLAADPDSQGLLVTGAAGPIATQETTDGRIDIDGVSNGYVSLASMLLPSNDAFIGTDQAVKLFDAYGNFRGAQTLTFGGSDVYDAGTEVNTELDAAFINQTAPNTGLTENGVVTLHPGFNGAEGNPIGDGDQIIIGGTNAFGVPITDAADFTREDAEIAVVHINTVTDIDGTNGRDIIRGGRSDDIVDARNGNDSIVTRNGWDVIDAGRGDDQVNAGYGDDIIKGGKGNDFLRGHMGDDTFMFAKGDGYDRILDFNRRSDDKIVLDIDGIEDFADVLSHASEDRRGTMLEFGGNDRILLKGVDIADLVASDFAFGSGDDYLM